MESSTETTGNASASDANSSGSEDEFQKVLLSFGDSSSSAGPSGASSYTSANNPSSSAHAEKSPFADLRRLMEARKSKNPTIEELTRRKPKPVSNASEDVRHNAEWKNWRHRSDSIASASSAIAKKTIFGPSRDNPKPSKKVSLPEAAAGDSRFRRTKTNLESGTTRGILRAATATAAAKADTAAQDTKLLPTPTQKGGAAVLVTTRDGKSKRYVGYRFLDELSNKEPFEIMATVSDKNSGFCDLLNVNELQPAWLMFIMRITGAVCKSEFLGSKYEMLSKFCDSRLLHSISYYLGEMCLESDARIREKFPEFVDDLAVFYDAVIGILPAVAFEKDFKKLIGKTKLAIGNLESQTQIRITESRKEDLDRMTEQLDVYASNSASRIDASRKPKYHELLENVPPPESFRELSLYPTLNDFTRSGYGFVRPNKEKGAYDSVDHYLDVQFRLLREDFVDPLRTGIRKYLQAKELAAKSERMKYKYESIRLYTNVTFEDVTVLPKSNVVGYVVNFDERGKLRKINWEYSKRLIYGSLILFTKDDFKSFFYGTVVARDTELCQKGRIIVSLPEEFILDNAFFATKFLMVESEVYFEPYFTVLKALLDMNAANFPMVRYIIEGKSDTRPPDYLAYLNKPRGIYQLQKTEVIGNVLDFGTWPSMDSLGLDSFQYNALKAAITRDFTVIQGPPGTGKTFLGLKIVQILLLNFENFLLLQKRGLLQNIRPILIVCYTNHALDQFLEGMLPFTKDIIRIGGQSKSELLRQHNLRSTRNIRARQNLGSALYNARNEIAGLISSIGQLNKYKDELKNPAGIVAHSILQNLMNPLQKRMLKNDDDLVRWLVKLEENYGAVDVDLTKVRAPPMTIPTEVAPKAHGTEHDSAKDNEMVDEYDLHEETSAASTTNLFCLEKETLKRKYAKAASEKEHLGVLLDTEQIRYHQFYNMETRLNTIIESYIFLDKVVERIPQYRNEAARINYQIKNANPFQLARADRWCLYWYWIEQLIQQTMEKLKEEERKYSAKSTQYEELKQIEDLSVVKTASIIGMTTSCAARLQKMLKTLSPVIVVVEEAAEVLESHIVSSLTNKCQHVILIGDHKQLKPSAAVYDLAKNYKIDVSLFERMINNKMDCPTLNVQHRMRPEISSLITPLIYPNLQNHPSVLEFPHITCVKKNLFFVEHSELEQEVDDTSSRKNTHEADFLLELARYLILNGYNAEKITILTTYAGQMFHLREKRKMLYPILKNVKIIVVDKYQGEENDIILLSLVRSNVEKKIGFLKTENRVCVALSRARNGLYIIGNMENLTESSVLWQKIRDNLQQQDSIGSGLPLECTQHLITTVVSKKEDFENVKEGGCNQYCGVLKECGHNCRRLCHPQDKEHKECKCYEVCSKACPSGHPCKRFCYQECDTCQVPVEKTLPCGHVKTLACSTDETKYKCTVKIKGENPICQHEDEKNCGETWREVKCSKMCEDRLDCGHSCVQRCHKLEDPDHLKYKCKKPCEKKNKGCSRNHICGKLCHEACGNCTVIEEFTLNCGHMLKLHCCVDLNGIECRQNCEKLCPDCKKKCRKKCFMDCKPCMNVINKVIPDCGHKIRVKCYVQPKRKLCAEKCERTAPCGHRCQDSCGVECAAEKCNELVKLNSMNGPCGHRLVVPCSRKDSVEDPEEFLRNCMEPCNQLLKCGDPCAGTCGKCWQGRMHIDCQQKCGNVLVCGHSCDYPCRQTCPPCNKKCSYRCRHSRCPKKCGVPCQPCRERCEWRCKHERCTRKCGEMCNRLPCYVPCMEELRCGHKCIGFCGEPCPPKCLVCDKEELMEPYFGWEDEPDARFVWLLDCNHIIESRAMEKHLSYEANNGEVLMKLCPLCKTPIAKTLRYMNIVKETYNHIINIKKKIYGNERELKIVRRELAGKLQTLDMTSKESFTRLDLQEMEDFRIWLLSSVPEFVKGRSNEKCYSELFALSFIATKFLSVAKLVTENQAKITNNSLRTNLSKKVNNFLRFLKGKNVRIASFEMQSINSELLRLQRYIHFYAIKSKPNFEDRKAKCTTEIASIERTLADTMSYTTEVDTNLEVALDKVEKIPLCLISVEEKTEILKAMRNELGSNQKQGHWYACGCGYVYSVANCGHFNQGSVCPQCHKVIGRGSSNAHLGTTFWDSSTR